MMLYICTNFCENIFDNQVYSSRHHFYTKIIKGNNPHLKHEDGFSVHRLMLFGSKLYENNIDGFKVLEWTQVLY